ncbi:MAG: hypothetical protein R2748_03190 [Bryobacterales bacterium]
MIEDQPVGLHQVPRILATTRSFFDIVTQRRMRAQPPFTPAEALDRARRCRD